MSESKRNMETPGTYKARIKAVQREIRKLENLNRLRRRLEDAEHRLGELTRNENDRRYR